MPSIAAIIVALLVIAVGLFFSFSKKKQEEVYDAPPVPTKSPEKAQCVLVLGAGTIGSSFTSVFMACGMTVINVDPMVSRDVLEKRIQEYWPYLVARGLTTAKEPPFEKSLTTYESISEAIEKEGTKITFVQECTWEQVENKQKVLAELDGLLDPNIMIASSTSYIPWGLLSRDCQNKHRILIGHPTIPHVGAYMEVYGVSPEWAQRCKEWYTDASFIVIVMKKTIPGHVFNSILRVNMEHGAKLVRDGICTPEDVNLAMRTWGRGLYTSHAFLTLLIVIGGDRGTEGGQILFEKIKKEAVYLVLYSKMIEKGVPDFLAQPLGKHLGQLLLGLLPERPEEMVRASQQIEEVLTEGGKIPVTKALFDARADVYKNLPFEVGNDPFGEAVPKSK